MAIATIDVEKGQLRAVPEVIDDFLFFPFAQCQVFGELQAENFRISSLTWLLLVIRLSHMLSFVNQPTDGINRPSYENLCMYLYIPNSAEKIHVKICKGFKSENHLKTNISVPENEINWVLFIKHANCRGLVINNFT